MKGVFIFNSMNDVSYLWCDDAFHAFVTSRLEALGFDVNGENDEDGNNATTSNSPFRFDPNLIMQAFSPLIASMKFMIGQVHNPYNDITFDDGLLFAFNHYDDDIYVAVNGDDTETDDFLHRKLDVLHKIMTFMFGPVSDIMMSDAGKYRGERIGNATKLLETWTRLEQTEQSFLIEAVERLHVNQMLNARSIELLETVMEDMKSATEKPMVHALLVVNSKLLALYSSSKSSDLCSADILMTILLVNSMFDWPSTPSDSTCMTEGVGKSDSSDQEFFSIPSSTPTTSDGDKQQQQNQSQSNTSQSKKESSADSSQGVDGSESVREIPELTLSVTNGPGQDQSVKASPGDTEGAGAVPYMQNLNPEVLSNTPVYSSPTGSPRMQKRAAAAAKKQEKVVLPVTTTVFLRTPLCRYAPHTLQCVPVLHDTALILITETARPSHPAIVTHLLSLIRSVLRMADDAETYTSFRWGHQMTLIDMNVKKLGELGKLYKGVTSVERILEDVNKNWEQLKKKHGFSVTNIADISPTAERTISLMQTRLKELFRLVFITPEKIQEEMTQHLSRDLQHARILTERYLADYADYLSIKAQRNVTITTYLEDFPGLVHFVYVDRTADHMTAPSINIPLPGDTGDGPDMSRKIKEKVWEKVRWCQSRLAEGYTNVSVKDGDFLYTYYLWFEDPMGNALNVQQPYRGSPSRSRPGILGSAFYRDMITEVFPGYGVRPVHCHELLCVHVGLVPPQYVISHCRKLAAMLWETSGEAGSPISLL